MTFIVCLCSALLGGVIHSMGYSFSDWQFWAILILYCFPNLLWLYRDSNHPKECAA